MMANNKQIKEDSHLGKLNFSNQVLTGEKSMATNPANTRGINTVFATTIKWMIRVTNKKKAAQRKIELEDEKEVITDKKMN